MLEEGLDSLLRANPVLMLQLASGPQPVLLGPDDALPALTYSQITGGKEYTLSGNGVARKLFQFDAWSRDNGRGTYAEVKTIQAILRASLDGWSGTLSDGTVVLSITVSNEGDFYESDSRSYRCMSEFEVQYQN